MPRNNYYGSNVSFTDHQPVPSYASNVPAYPQAGGEGGHVDPMLPPTDTDIDPRQYPGSEDPSYDPTTLMRNVTVVDTAKDSINSVILVVGCLVCTKGEDIGRD